MTADSRKLELVQEYLKRFHESIVEKSEKTDENKASNPLKLLFRLDKTYSFLIDTTTVPIRLYTWQVSNRSDDSAELERLASSATCTIQSDVSTFAAMAQGRINPMTAFLQGTLKFQRDRKILKDYGFAFKEAVLPKNSLKNSLSVKVLRYLTTIPQIKQQKAKGKDQLIEYVLEVSDVNSGQIWQVVHRYHDVVLLKRSLLKQGHRIPELHGRRYILSGMTRIDFLQHRMKSIQNFINEALEVIGDHNAYMNKFLEVESHILQSTNNTDGLLNKQQSKISAQLEAYKHLQSQEITWNVSMLHSAHMIFTEISMLQAEIQRLTYGIHGKGTGSWLRSFQMIVVHGLVGYITLKLLFFCYFDTIPMKLPLEFLPLILTNSILQECSKSILITLVVILTLPMTRKVFSFYTVLVGTLLPLYSVFLSLLPLLTNQTLSIPSMNVFLDHFLVGISIYFNHLRHCFLQFFTLLFTLCLIPYTTLTFTYSYLFYIFLSLCCLPMIILVQYASYRRMFALFSLGVTLIFIYSLTKLIIYCLYIPLSQQEIIYHSLDSLIVPYITQEIKEYRSIFIKFAQYFSARADLFTSSNLWAKSLSTLQDACPASSPEYVKALVEKELHLWYEKQAQKEDIKNSGVQSFITIDDIFDDFNYQPVASASIGQAHKAIVNLTKCEKVRFQAQYRREESAVIPAVTSFTGMSGGDTGNNGQNVQQQQHEEQIDRWSLTSLILASQEYLYDYSWTHPKFSQLHGSSNTATKTPNKTQKVVQQKESFAGEQQSEEEKEDELIEVVIKVQHENIAEIMLSDMMILTMLINFVAKYLDKRWSTMVTMLASWQKTLVEELDFHVEGSHLREMQSILQEEGQLSCVTPYPLPGLVFQHVMVMTYLHGYKVTNKLALTVYGVDRSALLAKITHAVAYQLLVAGLFNADPHAGNVFFSLVRRRSGDRMRQRSRVDSMAASDRGRLSRSSIANNNNRSSQSLSSSNDNGSNDSRTTFETRPSQYQKQQTKHTADDNGNDANDNNNRDEDEDMMHLPPDQNNTISSEYEIVPGLLDFGMTVRIKPDRRRAYCKLIIALFEGDLATAGQILQSDLGYQTNQSHRAPERDAEFFAYIFRDAGNYSSAKEESSAYWTQRNAQKAADEQAGVRENGGRNIDKLPEDFLFLTRVMGLLRGLTAELDSECPILYIMALQARVGLMT